MSSKKVYFSSMLLKTRMFARIKNYFFLMFGLEWLNLLLFFSLEGKKNNNFELVYYYIVVIVPILFKINVDAAVAANGHCYQTLVKMVNRLHSNLCSLADCIKQLQRLFTHNTNG